MRVGMPLGRGVLDTALCDKVSVTCSRTVVFSVSSTNKTDHHDITEILLRVVLNTINLNPFGSHLQTEFTYKN